MCLSSIKMKYHLLTSKEKQVADFILNHAEQVVSMPVAELAEGAGVVKSAVIRCCKSLGFRGYAALKISLAKELVRNVQFNYVPYIAKEDGAADIMDKIFSANIKTLHDTREQLDHTVLCEFVEALAQANRIYIYGIGSSAGIVNDFQYRLMQLGYTAFCFTDVVSMKVSALNIREGDMAIGICNSGRTIPTVEALRTARERGARTACVTSYPDSDIIRHCDHPLVIATDEIQYPIEAISARIAHISVLDAIAVSLSAKNPALAAERSAQVHDAVNTLRYGKEVEDWCRTGGTD